MIGGMIVDIFERSRAFEGILTGSQPPHFSAFQARNEALLSAI
jgi:hypothetical protein